MLGKTWVQLYNSMASTSYGELEANLLDACNKSCVVTASIDLVHAVSCSMSTVVLDALAIEFCFAHASVVRVERW